MKRKGYTLVEVLVSVFIFSAMTITCLTTYLLGKKFQIREYEYVFFESVCLDIDKYSDAYKDSTTTTWNVAYFGNGETSQYYDADFQHIPSTSSSSKKSYELSFTYNASKELIVNVENIVSNYSIIKDLNYGSSRYLNVTKDNTGIVEGNA